MNKIYQLSIVDRFNVLPTHTTEKYETYFEAYQRVIKLLQKYGVKNDYRYRLLDLTPSGC